MTRIGEKYREAALALVAKAYSTIKIADLAVYLGQVNSQVLCVNNMSTTNVAPWCSKVA